MFQFLVGTIKTPMVLQNVLAIIGFQFLVGTIKTQAYTGF